MLKTKEGVCTQNLEQQWLVCGVWAGKQNWAFPWEPWLESERMAAESKQTAGAGDMSFQTEEGLWGRFWDCGGKAGFSNGSLLHAASTLSLLPSTGTLFPPLCFCPDYTPFTQHVRTHNMCPHTCTLIFMKCLFLVGSACSRRGITRRCI